MMDEKLPPPSNRKRKLEHTDSAANQRALPAKKPMTGASVVKRQASSFLNHIPKQATTAKLTTQLTAKTTRPAEQNAKAGPSNRRNVVLSSPEATPTSTRVSSRDKRPTPKKTAPRMVSLESDSDFGSGDDPPLGIIKTPKRKKMLKKKVPQRERPYSARTAPKVVHLGAIELTDSTDDDLPKRPAKRHKAILKPSFDDTIINLCSDDQGDYMNDGPSKIPTCTKALVMEIMSSENEDPCLELPGNSKELENEMFGEPNPLLFSPENPVLTPSSGANQMPEEEVTMVDLTMTKNPSMNDVNIVDDIQDPIEQEQNVEVEIGLKALQDSYNKALDHWNEKLSSLHTRDFVSKLATRRFSRPRRDIIFSDDLPTVELNTPLFFSRAISDAKSLLEAARKREKKRRALQDMLSIQTCPDHVQSTSVDVSLVVMTPVEAKVDTPPPHHDDLHSDRQLDVETTAEIRPLSVFLSPFVKAQSFPPPIQNNTSRPLAARISTEHLREPTHPISRSNNLTSIANACQDSFDTENPLPTISLDQEMQICSPSRQGLLDASISELTLSSLTGTYDEDDDDDDISLSGLEFSYPSTGVY